MNHIVYTWNQFKELCPMVGNYNDMNTESVAAVYTIANYYADQKRIDFVHLLFIPFSETLVIFRERKQMPHIGTYTPMNTSS